MLFSFEDFELDADQLELRKSGEVVALEPQVFSLLELLVANAHRVVGKNEINEKVWGGRAVSEAALSSRIRSVRQAVGDDGRAQRLIKTLRDRGFRFVGDVVTTGARPERWGAGGDERGTTVDVEAEASVGPSIAVLPLQMLTDDVRYESLADAISHEIITDLSRLGWLRVIARGSSFRFRGADLDLREVGRVLDVRYVLSGGLSLFGRRGSLSLELARVETGDVVWADRSEHALDDLLEAWQAVTNPVAAAIEGRIETLEAGQAVALPTENLDAWTAYFVGLRHMYRFNPHDNDIASRLFERALQADPGFARAHAGLSFTHFQNGFVGFKSEKRDAARLASLHAEKAFELNPLDPLNVLTMGRAEILHGRWQEAAPWLDRATEMNPNYAWAYYHRALSDAVIGEGAESPGLAMQAISLSPIDPLYYAMLASRALGHLGQGEYLEASKWADRAAHAPGAHVIISAIACIAASLAEDIASANAWADDIRARDTRFSERRFFASFPIRHAEVRERVRRALVEAGF